ncbi:MAG TPA: multidrug effflux MFS transporter [Candidatus Sulfotelmatobacter sp.]|nr:multidrug effflux MFS transporter [Candidatus Sulfotelmatobacter sp.]
MATLRRDSVALILLLALLTAISPLSTDMFLPSLPSMIVVFHTDAAEVQLTLSVYLFGFAVAHLFYGPTADRFGRRPVLLTGLVLYVGASFACVFAPSIELLIVARFMQAIGASAGPVLGRTIVRDLHSREQAARMLSYVSMTMGLAPTVAPVIGGYLQTAFGWRASFVCLSALGIATALAVWGLLGETLARPDPQALHPRRMLANLGALLASPIYVGYALTGCFCFAGLFAFISGSSFVLVDVLHLSAQQYGFAFGLNGIGVILGATIGGRVTLRFGIDRMLLAATPLAAAAGLAMAALAWAGVHHVAAVIAPMFVYTLALGIILSQSIAGAVSPFPHIAGIASALLGFLQMSIASFAGLAVGQFYDASERPMASTIALMGSASLVLYWLLIWRRR